MAAHKQSLEARFERGLFASRWLMAPMYLGLVISLAMLTLVFIKELVYYASKTLTMTADQGILAVLTLIDLSLAANLLLIVLFSGYENFVSKLDGQGGFLGAEDEADRLDRGDFGDSPAESVHGSGQILGPGG